VANGAIITDILGKIFLILNFAAIKSVRCYHFDAEENGYNRTLVLVMRGHRND
jgi:hypothetical protein